MPKYKYKLTENGTIMVNDAGFPIVVGDDEKEFGLDGISLYTKVPSLNEENKTARTTITGLNEKLETFAGIEDPVAAIKALETVQNFSDKDLVDAKEVEKIKEQLGEAFKNNLKEEKTRGAAALAQKDELIAKAEHDLFDALVSSQFSKSPFFVGPDKKTKLTPAIGLAYFRGNFKVEDDVSGGKAVVGYYSTGEKIVSQQNPLQPPTFDEAIGAIIENHPDKVEILNESAGGGAKGNKGGITIVGPQQISGRDVDTISGNLDKVASGELTVVSSQG